MKRGEQRKKYVRKNPKSVRTASCEGWQWWSDYSIFSSYRRHTAPRLWMNATEHLFHSWYASALLDKWMNSVDRIAARFPTVRSPLVDLPTQFLLLDVGISSTRSIDLCAQFLQFPLRLRACLPLLPTQMTALSSEVNRIARRMNDTWHNGTFICRTARNS